MRLLRFPQSGERWYRAQHFPNCCRSKSSRLAWKPFKRSAPPMLASLHSKHQRAKAWLSMRTLSSRSFSLTPVLQLPKEMSGEIVITSLDPQHPWIRLALGDLTAALPGSSPCGRTNIRIKGWLGRVDQTTKVKGMFVRPEQIAEIASRHPELGRMRLVVSRAHNIDSMTLKIEAANVDGPLKEAVGATLRAVAPSLVVWSSGLHLGPYPTMARSSPTNDRPKRQLPRAISSEIKLFHPFISIQ